MLSRRDLVAPVVFLGLAVALSGAPASAQNARGEALFELCAQCHGAQGAGNQSLGAPAISGLSPWYVKAQLEKFKAGARGTHPDDITGMRMRPMSMTLATSEDIEAVAEYVAGLPPANPAPVLEGGDAARGQQLYAPCTACHGAGGDGNPNLNGPALKHASDWYLLAQLEKFRAGVRGTNPADQTGALMRPMSMILADEQAMKDVIAYIMTLSK